MTFSLRNYPAGKRKVFTVSDTLSAMTCPANSVTASAEHLLEEICSTDRLVPLQNTTVIGDDAYFCGATATDGGYILYVANPSGSSVSIAAETDVELLVFR